MKKIFLFLLFVITNSAFGSCDYKLHIGTEELNLCSTRKTNPSLNVMVDNNVYYANATTDDVPMNKHTQNKLKILYKNKVYSVYDYLWCDKSKKQYDIGFESCATQGASFGLDKGYYDYLFTSHPPYNVDKYGLTDPGTWAAEFTYGIVRGIASCNNTPGTQQYTTAETSQDFTQTANGGNCWCKLVFPNTSEWIYDFSSSATQCERVCAYYCSHHVLVSEPMQGAIFSSANK